MSSRGRLRYSVSLHQRSAGIVRHKTWDPNKFNDQRTEKVEVAQKPSNDRSITIRSPFMVQAILNGKKWQERVPIDPMPIFHGPTMDDHRLYEWRDLITSESNVDDIKFHLLLHCPYHVGQRLWVRETWSVAPGMNGNPSLYYKANGPSKENGGEFGYSTIKWKPCTQMPCGYSRITLDVTGVRVDRLHNINEEDVIAEGIVKSFSSRAAGNYSAKYLVPGLIGTFGDGTVGARECQDFRQAYSELWDSIHINPAYQYVRNPFVYVIEFKVIPRERE